MNRKKLAQLIIMICLCMMMIPAVSARAANVKIQYKGKTSSYSRKGSYLYIHNKKISVPKQPTFMKDSCYMGSITPIFKNSALGASVKTSSTRLIITYKDKKLIMQNGKKTANLNNKTVTLDTKVLKATYRESKLTRWIVPLKCVCQQLGIPYEIKNQIVYIACVADDQPGKIPDPTVTPLILCLDAGHGGGAPGASGKLYIEKNMTLEIVNKAAKYFANDHRFKVYYTRTTDVNPSFQARTDLANKNKADLFISVHINSANSKATGTETLYNLSRLQATKKRGITSKILAQAMQNGTVAATGFTDRGLKDRADLYVLNHTTMPACLIEYGFISNPKEEITMHANLAKYAKALYDTVVSFTEANHLLPE